MTLTYPILNRSQCILWLVTGSEKADMPARLRDEDRSIPAGLVHREQAIVLADPRGGRVGSSHAHLGSYVKTPFVCLVHLVSLVLIWLLSFNQKTRQTKQRSSFLTDFFSILLAAVA